MARGQGCCCRPLAMVYRSMKRDSSRRLSIPSLAYTRRVCVFTVLSDTPRNEATSLIVHPRFRSIAMENSVVVRLSATSSCMRGLWTRRQPALKRYVMSMMSRYALSPAEFLEIEGGTSSRYARSPRETNDSLLARCQASILITPQGSARLLQENSLRR